METTHWYDELFDCWRLARESPFFEASPVCTHGTQCTRQLVRVGDGGRSRLIPRGT